MTATDVPEGFELHTRRSPLTDPWEPLYSKRTGKAVILGLRLAKPHRLAAGGLEDLARTDDRSAPDNEIEVWVMSCPKGSGACLGPSL